MDYDYQYSITDGTAQATGALMHRMVARYHTDMIPFAHLSLSEIFDLIASIPYKDDPSDETLQRPWYTLHSNGDGGDCDDKAIAIASYAVLHGYPYRFVAVQDHEHNDFHHVYTEILINSVWVHADCTYNFENLGVRRKPYARYATI